MKLRLPELLDGEGQATQMDAAEAAGAFQGDAAYLDPPYNQHSYRSNYHIWETLVRWDRPEVYGVARKRIDCKTEKSAFNSRPNIETAFGEVLDALDVARVVVSFNNEGYLARETIEEMLARRGRSTHWLSITSGTWVRRSAFTTSKARKSGGSVTPETRSFCSLST